MKRTPLLAGNWKMHKTIKEALVLAEELANFTKNLKDKEVLICPPFTCLYAISKFLEGKNLRLGAQNLFYEEKGAYTGEISPLMLKELNCQYVLIGHSERRQYFKEDDDLINKKVLAAVNFGITPILCVGETLKQRESGETQKVVSCQVKEALKGVILSRENLVMAYEPIWAIGTGKSDTPKEANHTIQNIREVLAGIFGHEAAEKIRILYGGSVKAENVDAFMQEKEIDGALVGGASLNAESFIRIINFDNMA